MKVCFYFQVHQPFRIRKFSFFEIGKSFDFFDDKKNREIFLRASKKCYLPTNKILLDAIKKYDFKVNFSITGTFIEQCKLYNEEVLDSFIKLVETGNVGLLCETYYHSLAFLISRKEFEAQVRKHRKKIREIFGIKPKVFRNTEATYNNEIAKWIYEMGFKATIAEGWDYVLKGRSPNFVYKAKDVPLKVFLRNYRLSDDIGFRFSSHWWDQHPLTSDKYAEWIKTCEGQCVNIFLDYETFGEHHWPETGIHEFLKHLPLEFEKRKIKTLLIDELLEFEPIDVFDVPHFLSWADVERDLSAWLGNKMQVAAFNAIKELEDEIKAKGDEKLLDIWRKLTTSDHFYYMCTKWFADGDVHKYFNPFENPYEAFTSFMNIVRTLRLALQ